MIHKLEILRYPQIKHPCSCYRQLQGRERWPQFYFVAFVILFKLFSAVTCPKLTVPDNGGVIPASCSKTDIEYGIRCVFYCDDGYALSGPRYTTCQADQSWSELASLSCVRGKKHYYLIANEKEKNATKGESGKRVLIVK